MFESLKHWFDSLEEESKLFTDTEDEALHTALASVLFHIMKADQEVSSKEQAEFVEILRRSCELNDEQIDHLYATARATSSDLLADLKTVDTFLNNSPVVRMNFMRTLNHLVTVDGVKDKELRVFYHALHQVFPNIKV